MLRVRFQKDEYPLMVTVQIILHTCKSLPCGQICNGIICMTQTSIFSTDLPVFKNSCQEMFANHLQTQVQSSSGAERVMTFPGEPSCSDPPFGGFCSSIPSCSSLAEKERQCCAWNQARVWKFSLMLCGLSGCCCSFSIERCET